jgi:hypothetical protein
MFEKKWLRQGKQTKITPLVKQVADSINGEGLKLIENISNYIVLIEPKNTKKLGEMEEITKEEEFLASAEQLLTNPHWIKGCHTVGTIFRALCIAKGIPAVFIETLNGQFITFNPHKDLVNTFHKFKNSKYKKLIKNNWRKNPLLVYSKWLKFTDNKYPLELKQLSYLNGLIEGHIFVDVFIDKKWYTIDPTSNNLIHDYTDYSRGGIQHIKIGKGRDRADIKIPTGDKEFRKWIGKKFRLLHLL